MLPVTALTEYDAENCPVRQVVAQLTGKWRILILCSLEDGPLRFGALKRLIGDITQRVLTESLRAMEREGYVMRHVDPGPPVAVSYELTERGAALLSKLKPLVLWAAENHADIRVSRSVYDQSK